MRLLSRATPSAVAIAILGCSRPPVVTEARDAATSAPSAPATTTSAGPTAQLPSPEAAPPAPDVDAAAEADLRWDTARNLEMVPYCLPVPVSYLAEDTSERWEHGRKVFVRRAPPPGAASLSRMDLSPTCGPRKLGEMFHDDEKAIGNDDAGATITVRALKRDSYTLSWRTGDRIHYGKVWAAKGDAGCFVKVVFDYDASEQPVFARIIGKVAAASPDCTD